MPAALVTPHTFRERILLFGGGGSGKSTAAMSAIRATTGRGFVLDNDYSYAWQRALETDFADIADRVVVSEVDADWTEATEALAAIVGRDDITADDWLIIDSKSSLYEFVQNHMLQAVTGEDVVEFMAKLQAGADDASDYARKLSDVMPWQLIKKEYAQKINVMVRRWPGHVLLTAEQKKVGRDIVKKPELADFYSHLGQMPAGEGRIHHVTATTLYLTKARNGEYRFTTVKDRNRDEREGEAIADIDAKPFGGFAGSYLMGVAGWKVAVR